MITEQARASNKPSKYQVTWHSLPQPLRQAVIAQLVKLLERHLLAQVESPKEIRQEARHD